MAVTAPSLTPTPFSLAKSSITSGSEPLGGTDARYETTPGTSRLEPRANCAPQPRDPTSLYSRPSSRIISPLSPSKMRRPPA